MKANVTPSRPKMVTNNQDLRALLFYFLSNFYAVSRLTIQIIDFKKKKITVSTKLPLHQMRDTISKKKTQGKPLRSACHDSTNKHSCIKICHPTKPENECLFQEILAPIVTLHL